MTVKLGLVKIQNPKRYRWKRHPISGLHSVATVETVARYDRVFVLKVK